MEDREIDITKEDFRELARVLVELGVNPKSLIPVAQAMTLVSYGTGYGNIEINISEGNIVNVRTQESLNLRTNVMLSMPSV